MKNFKRALLSSMFAASLFAGSSALAGTSTANLDISADVTNACSISTTAMGFGAYDPTSGTDAAGTGTLTFTCTNGAALSLMLDDGANQDTGSSDDAPLRRMKAGANYLNYGLFQEAGHTNTWGNSSNSDKTSTGTGAEQNLTVYGALAAGQNVPAGSYTDTVLATVSF